MGRSSAAFEDLLAQQAKSITHLIIRTSFDSNLSFELPKRVNFTKLEVLKLPIICIKDLDFLHYTPILTKLYIRQSNNYQVLEIFSDMFKNSRFRNKQFSSLKKFKIDACLTRMDRDIAMSAMPSLPSINCILPTPPRVTQPPAEDENWDE